jgi:hypothetical protein
MEIVKALYTKERIKLLEPVNVKGDYECEVIFRNPVKEPKKKKIPLSELEGCLEGVIMDDFDEPLEEMKEYM